MSSKDLIQVEAILDPRYVASYFVRCLRAYECDDDKSTDQLLRTRLYRHFQYIQDHTNSPFVTEYFDHEDNAELSTQMLLIYPWGKMGVLFCGTPSN